MVDGRQLMALGLATLVLASGSIGARALEPEGRWLFQGAGAERASIAGIVRPGLSCAGCHGRDGGGSRAGSQAFPDIGSPLLRSRTSVRPAYDAQLFARLLRYGIDSSGRTLSLAMPRFALTDAEVGALWRYLGALPAEERRGVASGTIRFGIATLPGNEEAGARVGSALAQAWAALGIPQVNGRKIQFDVIIADGDETEFDNVFAVVAAEPGKSHGSGLLARLAKRGIPVIGPMHYPDAKEEGLSDVVWLTAGERAIERVIAEEATAATNAILPGRNAAAEKAPAGAQSVMLSHFFVKPKDLTRLAAQRAEIVLLRPEGDPADPETLAPPLVSVLKEGLATAGRDLTRTRFLQALSRVALTPPNWPSLDYTLRPSTGTDAISRYRLEPRK